MTTKGLMRFAARIFRFQKQAFWKGDANTVRGLGDLLLAITQIQEILAVSSATHKQSIKTVAARLNRTRNGLYVRMDLLGLTRDDLYSEEDIVVFLKRNPRFGELVTFLEQQVN